MKEGKRTTDTITLGSGKLYVSEFTGKLPTNLSSLEVPENIIGWVKSGAAIEYSGETYTAEDDLGMVSKTKLTTENVTLKCGLITWNGNTLTKLCSTASTTEEGAVRTTKLGGSDNGKSYIVRFVHEDETDGNVRVTIVGRNTEGLSFTFAPDSETIIEPTFTAKKGALDSEGTLVIIEEEIAPAA